jgi:hypothetical protein
LPKLQLLKAQGNQISDISPFWNHAMINYIDISDNKIHDIESIYILATSKYLRTLMIEDNPFVESSIKSWLPERDFPNHPTATYPPSWRLYIIYKVTRLLVLNNIPVVPEEKVAAINYYNPPTEVSISIQHMNITKLTAKEYAKIKCEDLLQSGRLRPIVLCGPNGAGKRSLSSRLLLEFPHIYGRSTSHTSRQPREGEEHGEHYWFSTAKKMETMNTQGKFVQLVKLFGNLYGTAKESIDRITEQGRVCVMALEYEVIISNVGCYGSAKVGIKCTLYFDQYT